MYTYMQRWRVLVKQPKYRGLLDAAMGEIRSLQARMRSGA
jgi:hypothetical protein